MDISGVADFITTLGFPIACVIAMAWFIYKAYEKLTTETKEREDKLYQVIFENQAQLKEVEKTNASFIEILDQLKDEIRGLSDDVEQIKSDIRKDESNE